MPAQEHASACVQEHGPQELPLRVVKLNELVTRKQEPAWARDHRLARTLVKQG